MNQSCYQIGDYRFYSQEDYKAGLNDLKKIKTLMAKADLSNPKIAAKLYQQLLSFPDMFETAMGDEFVGKLLQCANGQTTNAYRILHAFDEKPEDSVKNQNLVEEQKTVNRTKSKPAKKELVIFLAGMLTCFILYNVGNAIYYQVASSISIKNLEVLAASVLQPINAEVSEEHKDMDQRASGSKNDSTDLASGNEDGKSADTDSDTKNTEELQPKVLYMYSLLYETNKDIAGWIKIDGTVINYPVMQTKTEEEYYINRNFDKKNDINGLPFIDSRCDILEPTSNTIIYAHNMKNGSMFASLLQYKQEEFYKEHKVIQFDSIYETATYEIVAAFQTKIAYQYEDVFRYYQFIDAASEEEYNSFIQNIKKLSYYDTGVTAQYGEQLLTLSTCDRSIEDGRFVIVAKKVSSGSDMESAQMGKVR